jgi:thiamine-monophosphate kinase
VHEFDLIARIRQAASDDPRVPLGIGDDAAVIRSAAGGEVVAAVDTLMEGVDFTFPPATPELAGRKALAVNLSDLAAMAARPLAALVAAVFPKRRGAEFAGRVMDGCLALAKEFNIALAGGDTNTWDGPLVLSVTVLGEPTARGVVRRDGAQVGDAIMVTGPLGGSLLRGRHLRFTPRVHEALALHDRFDLHAMIDVSDGVGSDLQHILDASDVGAVLDAAAIPIHPDVQLTDDGRGLLDRTLSDGEDFELLFTVSPDDARRIEQASLAVRIGEIVEADTREIVMPDGAHIALPRGGWQHRF